MEHGYKKPCEVIKLDRYTGMVNMPKLLLMNRSFHTIGRIFRYDNWRMLLEGVGLDEISFEVHKYVNGNKCPIWDEITDLKIVDVDGFGRFEISVEYTDNTETVKSVHGFSLETELAQIGLYEFHVNDEEAADMEITEYSRDNYDSEGNFIPTVFYNPKDKKHSLLHRVLADKAPHWGIGYVTPWIALDEESQPEESCKFHRTYTANGETIYDFLTGTVSEESNVVFVFDTVNRLVNCYSLCDCIDQETGEVLCRGIGDDTFIYVDKVNLADEISISSDKDSVKNCFRIEGGDDVITDMVRAVNMNGSNYIYQFADFQYNDMSEELRDRIQKYQETMSSKDMQDAYYGNGDIIDNFLNGGITLQVASELDALYVLKICKDNGVKTDGAGTNGYDWTSCYVGILPDGTKELRIGSISYEWKPVSEAVGGMGIYTKLCNAYDILAYLESSMMPNTDMVTDPGTAQAQYDRVVSELTAQGFYVAVSSVNNYNDNLFVGVTNNVEAYAQVFLDSRFDLSIVDGSASYNSSAKTWTGKIQVVQHTDGKNVYPVDASAAQPIVVKVNDDELEFAKQKVHKALSKSSMADIDFKATEMSSSEMYAYFCKYSLNRLKSFYDGYNSCISILAEMGQTTASDVQKALYEDYEVKFHIAESALKLRQSQVDDVNRQIKGIQEEQRKFQEDHDFYKFLGDSLYKEFCSYRREDTYTNSNYVSDGLTTAGCLAKAKELVEAAAKEARKACVLQRTVSVSLGNLLMRPEFERLYESFALFNYIRVRTDDELLKLRIIGIEFAGESPEKIEVTFSDQVKSIDGKIDDLRSIIKQAASMATSYPSTALQAKQGSDAKNEITDMYANDLNAAKTMLTNNDSNEVTVTQAGILCKRMDDQGMYGDKQLRITGNIMAFTKDNWESIEMAIGEFPIYNPLTKEYEMNYGLGAPALVGEMIAGKNMVIGNEKGSVHIDGDGITISNGVIKSSDYEKNEETGEEKGSIIDLRDGSFSFGGGGLSYHEGNLVLKDGVIQSANYIPNKYGSIIDLTNGNFSFAGGGLTYDGDEGDNNLQVKGDIEATSIVADYAYKINDNGKKIDALQGFLNEQGLWSVRLWINENSYIELDCTEDKKHSNIRLNAKNIYHNGDTDISGSLNANSLNVANYVTASGNLVLQTNNENVRLAYGDGVVCLGKSISSDTPTFRPFYGYDAKISLGCSGRRWKEIYCASSTIITSDRNMKDNIAPLMDKHIKFFSLLQPVSFTFTDGTSGRTHIGFISQDVEDAMEKSGLTDLDFAGFCKTVKMKEVIDADGNKRYEAETDENGNPVYVYSLRYEEFIALNTFMIQRLFEDNRNLQKDNQNLREEVQSLKEDMRKIKEKLGILD